MVDYEDRGSVLACQVLQERFHSQADVGDSVIIFSHCFFLARNIVLTE